MPRYHIDSRMGGSVQALAAAFKTGISLFNGSGGTSPGGRLVSIAVGLDGSPNASTDTQIVFAVSRLTADGTGITVTPRHLKDWWNVTNPRNTVKANYTAEPTYLNSNQLWLRVLNQRASMQWNGQDMDANPEWNAIQAGTAGTVPNGLVIIGSGGAAPVTANGGYACEFDE